MKGVKKIRFCVRCGERLSLTDLTRLSGLHNPERICEECHEQNFQEDIPISSIPYYEKLKTKGRHFLEEKWPKT